jgi:hypothetical protein
MVRSAIPAAAADQMSNQRPPAVRALEKGHMYRRKRAGDQQKHSSVIEALHDITRGAGLEHVIHAAHGKQECRREREDRETCNPGAVSSPTANQNKAQCEDDCADEVCQAAHRLAKARIAVGVDVGHEVSPSLRRCNGQPAPIEQRAIISTLRFNGAVPELA